MTHLDQAVHAHMAHGAMACDDPLTECLCQQMAPQAALPDDDAARDCAALQTVIRREYTRGRVWGVACGLCAGVCSTGTAVWLYHAAAAALQCPTC